MARAVQIDIELNLTFDCVIRGHHISKSFWTPIIGDRLECRHDANVDAISKDPDSIGVFHNNIVVGHTPGGNVSQLLNSFLNSNSRAQLFAVPTGKRVYEFGLVVPCQYLATLPKGCESAKKNIQTLKEQLQSLPF